MGFSQALSGLNAAAANLDVIGNNIANSQTVGFKSSNTQFADVFAGAKVGLGTRVAAVLQDFSTGTLEGTGRNMDLAINGEGFFRFTQNEQVVYSRNGQLTLDSEGYLQNAQGARLTGFPAGVQAGGGEAQALRVPSEGMPARASENVEATLNLDGRIDGIDRGAVPFDATNADSYSYANNVTLFDSQGNSHNATMYFTKDASTDNTWELRMGLEGDISPPETLTFDTNGSNTSTGDKNFVFTPDTAVNPINIALNLDDTTQFGKDFELNGAHQDGYTSGSLVGVTIDNAGQLVGTYSNEERQTLGTIAMVRFSNPEGLKSVGDNAWAETGASGQPLTGMAGSGQFGSIESGTVETSNVDLTRELVDMIIAQRTYQANSQTIKVQDEVLQNAVNL